MKHRGSSLVRALGLALLAGAATACAGGPMVAPLRYEPLAPLPDEAFRAAPPPASPVLPEAPQAFHRSKLANGLEVVFLERHTVPTLSVQLLVQRGAADLGAPIDAYGILRSALDGGTANHTASDISTAYARLGAPHRVFCGADGCGIGVRVGAESLDPALALVAETVTHPRLDAHAFNDLRSRWLQDFNNGAGSPQGGLQRNISAALFGGAHPYGFARPPRAHTDDLESADLVALHARLWKPGQATLVVVGDATPEAVVAGATRALGSWAVTSPPEPRPTLPEPPPGGAQVVFIERKGSLQVDAAVAARGPGATSPDVAALEVLSRLLGGFSSRLRGEVRMESGAAYNFGAYVVRHREATTVVVGGALDAGKAIPAIQSILAAIAEVRTRGVRQPDFERARTNLLAGWRTRIATTEGLASLVVDTLALGLPLESIATYPQRVQALTSDDVRRVAQRYLADADLRVVVGGAADVGKALGQLGLGEPARRDGWAAPPHR